ncbi:uncharacterized protein [Eurosta solidaginis]|uniref:uncharacterized protein n=1 Tax=Eurosta solidaginis TaxID=178769 RepID=UPI0035306034
MKKPNNLTKMNRKTLWLFVVILIVYFTLVFSDDSLEFKQNRAIQRRAITDLEDEARTRKHRHKLWYLWGWHALAIAYWVKVKLIIVGFFVGSAVFVALRYGWPSKCTAGLVHDTPTIVYDHPPQTFAHDHVPYSFDHSPNFDHSFGSSSSIDPYSAYAGLYSDDITATEEFAPSGPSTHRIKRQSLRQTKNSPSAQQGLQNVVPIKTEERIADLMFEFLGLDSFACRRRFICEMEFRARLNSLSSMAFRIVGRIFFEKYTNARNEFGQAHSFAECAAVNSDCVFIEHNIVEEIQTDSVEANDNENEIHNSLKENHNSSNEVHTNLEQLKEADLPAERRKNRSFERTDFSYKSVAALILEPAQRN